MSFLNTERQPLLSSLYVHPSFFRPQETTPAYTCPIVSPLYPLYNKLNTPPTANRDQLHPTAERPYVRYEDEGMWNTRIDFQKDNSPVVAAFRRTAAESPAFASLDVLCESELLRRKPDYQTVLSPAEINKLKKQIAFSACNRDDLISQPAIEDPVLRHDLGITNNDAILKSEHLFVKNSPMNGKRYMNGDQIVTLSQAIACSSDREVENTCNLRVVRNTAKESIAYTGRVDSNKKADEQAAFIFLHELATSKKGITTTTAPDGTLVYEMDYVINSMLSAPWILSKESILSSFPERQYVENEIRALQHLRDKGVHTITDPNDPSRTYQVKFNPILFSESTNLFVRLQKILPPFFTGEEYELEISEAGLSDLERAALKQIAKLQRENKVDVLQQIQSHFRKLKELDNDTSMEPEDRTMTKYLYRDHLCKLLNLPIVYHCKSSTDRTGITIALSQALSQWIALKRPLPQNLSLLLNDWRFKELYAANWMTGHQITRYARGGEGTIAGEQMNPLNLGYSLNRSFAQIPISTKLIPNRYLRNYSFFEGGVKKVMIKSAIALAVVVLSLLLVPVAIIRLPLSLSLHYSISKWDVLFPLIPLRALWNLPSLFPTQVFNEDSPQVGARRLVSGGPNPDRADDNT